MDVNFPRPTSRRDRENSQHNNDEDDFVELLHDCVGSGVERRILTQADFTPQSKVTIYRYLSKI